MLRGGRRLARARIDHDSRRRRGNGARCEGVARSDSPVPASGRRRAQWRCDGRRRGIVGRVRFPDRGRACAHRLRAGAPQHLDRMGRRYRPDATGGSVARRWGCCAEATCSRARRPPRSASSMRLRAKISRFEDLIADFIAPILKQSPQVLRAFKAVAMACARDCRASELNELETRMFAETWVHEDHWTAAEKITSKWRSSMKARSIFTAESATKRTTPSGIEIPMVATEEMHRPMATKCRASIPTRAAFSRRLPRAAVDDAAVFGIRHARGIQSALSIPARAGTDGAFGRARSADAMRLRPGRSDGAAGGRQSRCFAFESARDGDSVQRNRPGDAFPLRSRSTAPPRSSMRCTSRPRTRPGFRARS